MAASWVHGWLHWWLVEHPTFESLEWRPNETFGASVPIVAIAAFPYLAPPLSPNLLTLSSSSSSVAVVSPSSMPTTNHHAVVVVMCYVWLSTSQSLMPIALVTNAAVHVAMYAYYLSCSMDYCWPLRWNRAITELQIAQFIFSYLRM
ncbi:unnamed protein product [Musa acuminata subsp. malaccensis]|uniref:very-long-chain 3-oxoacyl-CoA synthase n=1 Tax=Musa acuminata subsp. malaccensis TaxID=214687 RepID=A0A804K7T1_MUSAM|nr:PREDICTED: uncharacterized protein LOC103994920 [Musa acuminata subsp. malaccensis]CAG1831944.1 unnamed protein product [Musa acuminata subsp. malaccensis]